MKTLLSFLLIITLSNLSTAQTTTIPDANFEQRLINLGYDTGIPNGMVPTSNINSITSLNIASQNISNLTGIEDFTAINHLRCENNQLTTLDLSNNTSLEFLWCNANQLTNLDISNNTNLTILDCGDNQLSSLIISNNSALTHLNCNDNILTYLNVSGNYVLSELRCINNQLASLDVSNNTALTYLDVNNNQLTNLNISNNTLLEVFECKENLLTNLNASYNTVLEYFNCSFNQLTCLNIKNGNNTNIWNSFFNAIVNPNLTCIEVDDDIWSTTNWGFIDPSSSFSKSCPNPCAVGINENSLSKLLLYPNPTTGSVNIDLEETKSNVSLRLTNALGQVILTKNYKSTNHINFDLNAPKGVYFLRLESNGEVITKKIIKE